MSTEGTTPASVHSSEGLGGVVPEPFCLGVPGREQCDTCEGRYVPDVGFAVPPRILVHQPWPFEPCPHYWPPFDQSAECSPTLTQCQRCKNPHHACDGGNKTPNVM